MLTPVFMVGVQLDTHSLDSRESFRVRGALYAEPQRKVERAKTE